MLMNNNDLAVKIDIDWYDILSLIWTSGYILLELQLMSRLSCAAKNRRKMKYFFSDSYLTFQFFSHLMVIVGMILKVATSCLFCSWTIKYFCSTGLPLTRSR